MPFEVPSLPTLINRAVNDVASNSLRKSDAQVLGRAIAGTAFGLYGYLGWIADQILPDTADEETLQRDATLRLETPRIAAKAATGSATFTAAAGAVLDANLVLQAADGRQYRTTASVTTKAGANTAALAAVEGGALGNATAGLQLTLVQPVIGVGDTFTVVAPGITGGADQESIEALRARVERSYQVIPHGGDADDYETWAREVAGVTRAWVRRNYMGPGTVGLFFVRDSDDPIVPDANEIATVKAYIETRRPVTAELYVLAPTLKPINYVIKVTPDTSAVRAAVTAELADLHTREAGLGDTLLISHIREAISSAAGENDNVVISPTANVTAQANELLTLGTISWQ